MSDTADKVAGKAEEKCGEHWGSTRRNCCPQEHSIEGDNLRGVRSKHVVNVEVHQNQNAKGERPGHTRNAVCGAVTYPINNLELFELIRHAHKHREENEGGPSTGVIRHIFPGEHFSHEKNCDAEEGCTGRANTPGRAANP